MREEGRVSGDRGGWLLCSLIGCQRPRPRETLLSRAETVAPAHTGPEGVLGAALHPRPRRAASPLPKRGGFTHPQGLIYKLSCCGSFAFSKAYRDLIAV